MGAQSPCRAVLYFSMKRPSKNDYRFFVGAIHETFFIVDIYLKGQKRTPQNLKGSIGVMLPLLPEGAQKGDELEFRLTSVKRGAEPGRLQPYPAPRP